VRHAIPEDDDDREDDERHHEGEGRVLAYRADQQIGKADKVGFYWDRSWRIELKTQPMDVLPVEERA
jgi:hypothetical protein